MHDLFAHMAWFRSDNIQSHVLFTCLQVHVTIQFVPLEGKIFWSLSPGTLWWALIAEASCHMNRIGIWNPHLSLLTGNSNAAILVVLNRSASFLYERTIACGCKEGWNPCTPCPNPLCQSTLWKKKGERLKDGYSGKMSSTSTTSIKWTLGNTSYLIPEVLTRHL